MFADKSKEQVKVEENQRMYREALKKKSSNSHDQVKLPSFAKTDYLNRITCKICGDLYMEINSFKRHIHLPKHSRKVEELKKSLQLETEMTQELKNYIENDESETQNFPDIQLGKRGPTNTLFYNEKIVIIERQDENLNKDKYSKNGVLLPEGFFDNIEDQKKIQKLDKRQVVTKDQLDDEKKLDELEDQITMKQEEQQLEIAEDQKKSNFAKDLMEKDTDYQLNKVKDRIAKLKEKRKLASK